MLNVVSDHGGLKGKVVKDLPGALKTKENILSA